MSCVVDYSKQPPVFRCTACNGTAPLSLPMSIEKVVEAGKAFQQAHLTCREEPKPAG